MENITEPQVIFAAKNGALESLRAVPTGEGFALYVKLKGFKEEKPIHTQRKVLKQWASLDRLVRHITTNYDDPPPRLIVELRSSDDEQNPSNGP
jgi:hypothetical protein